MALIRTYGKLELKGKDWEISKAEPHICIKLKSIFQKLMKGAGQPFKFTDNPETCHDMLWFMERYPLSVSEKDLARLRREKKKRLQKINDLEQILLPEYVPRKITLNEGYLGRDYQLRGAEVFLQTERILIGDDLGLGKTIIGILSFCDPRTLPAIVIVQTHLQQQWKEKIQEFTSLSVHVIKKTKPYTLPKADIYISKYSCLSGWANFFETGFFKCAIFDEIQELRHSDTAKYGGARCLTNNVKYALGLTATPIYNYGNEIYNIIDLLKEGSLGSIYDFMREWGHPFSKIIADPQALGTMLRENFLFLRRTRADVGRELPEVNKIVHTVGYDSDEAKKASEIAKTLAIKVTSGNFMERGQAARELDILLRHNTGVAKAKEVAEYVKILLENGEPVLLAGWHREVYEIWMRELAEYNPMLYTGSESPVQKEKTKQAFISGETNLMIISLRSGVGLDGLQERCKFVVFGELDWSPKIHDQVIARADRDGQKEQVTAIFLVTDYGSDPVIIDLLGLKASQSHNIIDPMKAVANRHSDESRIKLLAESFLKKQAEKTNIVQTEPIQ